MIEYFKEILQTPNISLISILALFVLGLVSAVASSCCNLAIIGVAAGYAGNVGQSERRRTLILSVIFFFFGSVLALTILGMLATYINRMLGMTLAKYWNFIAGLLLVIFGLITLGVSPIRLPKIQIQKTSNVNSTLLASIFGFVIGGALSAGCSLTCNPLFLGVLAFAASKPNVIIGGLLVAIYAIGYALPISLAILGISLGTYKLNNTYTTISKTLSIIVGILLLLTGFYMLFPK
jgi:cytochrome c-type biogenesis protein